MNPVRANMTYVYVLVDKANSHFYTGCTSDLRKRLAEHRSGKSSYTRRLKDLELIYYEACMDGKDAFVREKYLKTGMGKRYLKNRNKRFLALTG